VGVIVGETGVSVSVGGVEDSVAVTDGVGVRISTVGEDGTGEMITGVAV
jgi:hypothetical protein